MESRKEEIAAKIGYKSRKMRGCDFVLRVVAALFCLAAAVVLGVTRQTTNVGVPLIPGLPWLEVEVTAKWHFLTAFVYFLVANTIASGYAILSALLALINRGKRKGIVTMIVVFDLIMVALLFSSFAAGLAVGLIAYQGNTRLEWGKVCDVFGRYCLQAAVALGVSGAASLIFFLLAFLGILNLHRTP